MKWAAIIVLTLFFALPLEGQACAVCAPDDDITRGAFLQSTLFLSALPLLMLTGLFFWIRHQFKRAEVMADAESASTSPKENLSEAQ